MPSPTLIVMAAGIGSRYGGLKQMDPVGPSGEIILDYSIYDALKSGFEHVVFVIRKDIEEVFRDRVGKNIEQRCDTRYVIQSTNDVPPGFTVPPNRIKPWGTGHAVFACRDAVHTPFAVINADDFYGRASFQTLDTYLRTSKDRDNLYEYCMVGYILKNTLTEHGHVARGVCTVDENSFLMNIREHTHIERVGDKIQNQEPDGTWKDLHEDTIVSLNMWGFTPSLFAELEVRFPKFLESNRENILKAEYFLPDIVGDIITEEKARAKVLETHEHWFGVTYKEDKDRVNRAIQTLIQRDKYPQDLWRMST
jgi:NDP-sugar pyrophosphorylase family protein